MTGKYWLSEEQFKIIKPLLSKNPVSPFQTRNLVERCFNRTRDWRFLSLRRFRCPETFLAAPTSQL